MKNELLPQLFQSMLLELFKNVVGIFWRSDTGATALLESLSNIDFNGVYAQLIITYNYQFARPIFLLQSTTVQRLFLLFFLLFTCFSKLSILLPRTEDDDDDDDDRPWLVGFDAWGNDDWACFCATKCSCAAANFLRVSKNESPGFCSDGGLTGTIGTRSNFLTAGFLITGTQRRHKMKSETC